MLEKIISRLTSYSVDNPWKVIFLTLFITLGFGVQFPKVTTDTNPKHMLPEDSSVRQFNDKIERDFALHADVMVLGIVNKKSVFDKQTLSMIGSLTHEIKLISGVIVRDVVSLATIDDMTSTNGELVTKPILERIPETEGEMDVLRKRVLENPLILNRLVASDATAAIIVIPIESSANGKIIAEKIRSLLSFHTDAENTFYLAGDPVARDTFGAEMFLQMAMFSPIAGMIMCLALYFMFRSVLLVFTNMSVAMVSIIWSMGALIGLGYPVHIMSSMSPVFLMAIATDSVHIFNEFVLRLRESGEKRKAILETLSSVGKPVFFSDLTTILGFASLATVTIIPVKIFGLVVAFGTSVILLMSYTLVPALLSLLPDRTIIKEALPQVENQGSSVLAKLGAFSVGRSKSIALGGLVVAIFSVIGLLQARVNNNMVNWFKPQTEIRMADGIMNSRMGGTSTGYLVVDCPVPDSLKTPEMLRKIEDLQRDLEKDPLVGKTVSVVDFVKRINRALHNDDPSFEKIPDSAEEIGQYLFLFGLSARPTDLDNVVDYPFQRANIHLQLKSWDADVMKKIIAKVNTYLKTKPMPDGVKVLPAGIAYFNMIWNDEVLWGMVSSFVAGLVFVLVVLIFQTGSLFWGIITFLPLLFTILFIYGAVGFVGKDFDMPVAVLSTLSLGMAIDFAIHFVGRFQQRMAEGGDLQESLIWTIARPGKGIFLNAILFSMGFSVMVFADLTPYVTVGVLMIAIMLLSSVTSVFYLPALIQIFRKQLLGGTST